MIKVNMGMVENVEKNLSANVIAKSVFPNKLKDIAIGGGIVLIGIAYLTYTAFTNGVRSLYDAEFLAYREAGIIKNN